MEQGSLTVQDCIDMYEKLSSKTNFINSEILVKYIPFKTKNHYK